MMTLAAAEFLCHFGFLANRGRTAKLTRCRVLLAVPPAAPTSPEPMATLRHRLIGVDVTQCPACGADRLRLVAIFRPGTRPTPAPDSS